MALVGEAGEHGGLGGRKALCQQLDDAGDPDGFQVAAWGDSPAAGESAQQPVFADAGAVCQLVERDVAGVAGFQETADGGELRLRHGSRGERYGR